MENRLLFHLKTLDFHSAYTLLLQTPYDQQESSLRLFIHYLDAAAFGTRGDLFLASKELLSSLKNDSHFLLEYEELLHYLEQMHTWIQISLDSKASTPFQYPEALAFREVEQAHLTHFHERQKWLALIPPSLKNQAQELLSTRLHLNTFLKTNPLSYPDPFFSPLPWFLPTTQTPLPSLPEEEIPLALYCDPLSIHLKSYLHTHRNKKLWLLFENQTFLLQALAKLDTLSPHHYYYSLNLPLSQQWMTPPSWKVEKIIGCTLEVEAFASEEPLFSAGLQLSCALTLQRMGPSHLIPLTQRMRSLHWHSKQKTPFQATKELEHHIEQLIECHPCREKKKSKKPLKIAHLTAQLVDGGHAPSMLIENILSHHDKELFEPILICCEEMVLRTCEYPFNLYTSLPSTERGAKRLARLQNGGVTVFVDDGAKQTETTAEKIGALLDKLEVDIAVFHSPTLLHALCVAYCRVPVKVLFDHGTPPFTRGFDYAILSTKESQPLFEKLKIKTAIHSFPVDCRSGWEEEPYSPARTGLPEDGFLMTTISNNLELRLTPACLDAIARILQRCPYAYYAPIGYLKNQKSFKEFFYPYGVEDRVMPMGHRDNPSQIARSLHLYLNEFPIGSGFGALDAMSAGCPVVTMYDENGPAAAQYAALYFGKERAVRAGDVEGYVELAISLYQDKKKHKEWALLAKQQYEKLSDSSAYMIDFERTLLNWMA